MKIANFEIEKNKEITFDFKDDTFTALGYLGLGSITVKEEKDFTEKVLPKVKELLEEKDLITKEYKREKIFMIRKEVMEIKRSD